MKKILLPLAAVMLNVLSANAQKENDLVISAGDIKHITLGDDMNVVFITAKPNQNEMMVSKKFMEKMKVTFGEGSLQLMPQKLIAGEIVYVIVNGLQTVTLGQNTSLRAEGFLESRNIDLFINMGATARLKTTGKINAYSLGDFDVQIRRTPLFANAFGGIN